MIIIKATSLASSLATKVGRSTLCKQHFHNNNNLISYSSSTIKQQQQFHQNLTQLSPSPQQQLQQQPSSSSSQQVRPDGIENFILRDEPSSSSSQRDDMMRKTQPQEQRNHNGGDGDHGQDDYNRTNQQQEQPIKKKKTRFFSLRNAMTFLVVLATYESFMTYFHAQCIVRAEHDLREWEPELEKSMPSVFRSHVLKAVGDLRNDRSTLRKIEREFLSVAANDAGATAAAAEQEENKDLETKYTVQWVNLNTGQTTSGLNSAFIELLKQCDLSCRIDYLVDASVRQNVGLALEKSGSMPFLRVSNMTFNVPIQVTVNRVHKSDPSKVHSTSQITGLYSLSFVRYKDMARKSGQSPLLPPRDDWYMQQTSFRPMTSSLIDRSIVLNDTPQHSYFRIANEGKRILRYHKDARLEFIEKNYVWFGRDVRLYGTTTIMKKIVIPSP